MDGWMGGRWLAKVAHLVSIIYGEPGGHAIAVGGVAHAQDEGGAVLVRDRVRVRLREG